MALIPTRTIPFPGNSVLDAYNDLVAKINDRLVNLDPANVTITGGTINGTTIGNTNPAPGAFTSLTSNGINVVTVSGAQSVQDKAFTLSAWTGGTIDGAIINSSTIGLTTPAAAAFTTLSSGVTSITATDANAFRVGQNLTNPAFDVDTSAASSVTGLSLISAASGGSATLQVTSSAASEGLNVYPLGTGNLVLGNSTSRRIIVANASTTFTNTAQSFTFVANNAAATVRFSVANIADTALTAATEATHTFFNLASALRTHATGSYALQRDFRISGTTHVFATGGGTVSTMAAALAIDTPTAGNLATFANSAGLYIPSSAAFTGTGVVTNAYGAFFAAPTGGANNYALGLTGNTTTSGQLISTLATGTAPLVIASTTLVPNLYVARAVLADGVTTNANLTGVITSSGNTTSFGTFTSAQILAGCSDETGTGALVFATNPTITLANGTGLPISTGVSGLGTGIATFLATPSSANLIAAMTNETGTGSLVFNTSPSLVTPSSDSLNLTGATAPANGLYLPATNTLGFASASTKAGSIDATQQWGFGNFSPFSNCGVVQTYRAVTGGAPASAGAADSNQIEMIMGGNPTVNGLRIGYGSTGEIWMQASSATNFATNVNLWLQQNGGLVRFGSAAAGAYIGGNGINAIGSNTNISMNMGAQGNESCNFANGNGTLVLMTGGSGTGYLNLNASAGAPQIVYSGSTNIDAWVTAQGTGVLKNLGSYTNGSVVTPNLCIDSSGRIFRNSSQEKYKYDIEDMDVNRAIDIVTQIQPKWFRSNMPYDQKEHPDWSWYGGLAEQFAEVDPRLANWDLEFTGKFDKDNQPILGTEIVPVGINYSLLGLFAIVAFREQISALQAEVSSLKAAIQK